MEGSHIRQGKIDGKLHSVNHRLLLLTKVADRSGHWVTHSSIQWGLWEVLSNTYKKST